MHKYIYIYIKRERQREKESKRLIMNRLVIYMYTVASIKIRTMLRKSLNIR